MGINYCMTCGAPLALRDVDGTMRMACTAEGCSFVHWGNYSIGVGALVLREEKVLLVRRAQEPGKGYWTNPGGYIEQLEMIHDSIVREVKEETAVDAVVRGIVALRDLPRNIHNVYIAFAMDYVGGEPEPDGIEVDRAGFFSMEELESMNVAGFTRWLIDVALRSKNDGLTEDKEPIVQLDAHGLFRV